MWHLRWIGPMLAWSAWLSLAVADDGYDRLSAERKALQDWDSPRRLELGFRMVDWQESALRRGLRTEKDPQVRDELADALADLAQDQAQIAQARAAWMAASDPHRKSILAQDLDEKLEYPAECARLHAAWARQPDLPGKRTIGADLVRAAIDSYAHDDLVYRVASDGKFNQGEIALPSRETPVALTALGTFANAEAGGRPWVIRRLTSARFELWSPHHGWLFDAGGNIVNQARPPRRDGLGREWYGAFLPDGRWVTTDIWEQDCTLHFFSAAGKWIASKKGAALAAPADRDDFVPVIGWCRSGREGKGWVLSVGTNWNTAMATVSPEGRSRPVSDPWPLCHPRDLEPKGMYTHLTVPDDSGQALLHCDSDMHGSGVGFPEYGTEAWSVVIPEGIGGFSAAFYLGAHSPSFGFWPDSREAFIVADAVTDPKERKAPGVRDLSPDAEKTITWLYHADGAFAGWIAASRLADAEDGRSMLFDAGDGRVATLGPGYRVTALRRFTWPDGSPGAPEKIFPDLRRGLFWHGTGDTRTLTLARW